MFTKVFSQIFDSSIADNYRHRHVFMDLLVLADSEGVVDMTAGAIARRTNVPLEQVQEALDALCAPDLESRTPTEDGRRLLPIDTARGWGWRIVNYEVYRQLRDEESRREYFRTYRAAKRAEENAKGKGKTTRAKGTKPKKNGTNGQHLTDEDATLGGAPQLPHHRLAPHAGIEPHDA